MRGLSRTVEGVLVDQEVKGLKEWLLAHSFGVSGVPRTKVAPERSDWSPPGPHADPNASSACRASAGASTVRPCPIPQRVVAGTVISRAGSITGSVHVKGALRTRSVTGPPPGGNLRSLYGPRRRRSSHGHKKGGNVRARRGSPYQRPYHARASSTAIRPGARGCT